MKPDISFINSSLKTPYFIVDESLLIKNLEILKHVKSKTGCKILLAQKAFSMFSLYPVISDYLDGTTASGLYEAKLGKEHFGKECHVFSPAYTNDDFEEILFYVEHIVFNSFNQWNKFRDKAISSGKSCGLRINPEHSTQEDAIYDPCSPFSRLGITKTNFEKHFSDEKELRGIEGLHFHTLCEQNSDDLAETLDVFEENFCKYFSKMKWINFGGGHHITREDYDIDLLINCINRIQNKYNVQVYLEPGEAVVLNCGYLVSSVVDIVDNGMNIAVLDASAACHMPDVIEMPYRPPLFGSGQPNDKPFTYRLGGPTCLAGDIIGDYSFDKPLNEGDKLVFCDMALYTMVKTNTFNGMPLPSIAVYTKNKKVNTIKSFSYEDFKQRLS